MKPLLSKNNALPFLVFSAGMLATVVTWTVFDRQINEAEQLRFNRYSERMITTIQERLQDHQRLLEGGRGLFYASKSVDFDEWRQFVNAQHLERYPGILGFGYIHPVQRAQLPAFVAELRKQAPDFAVKSKGNYPDLFVITQIEPVSRNRAAWGFDIGQEANRREAAESAAAGGKATLTRRITLVQDQKKIAGFLMLLPIYQTKSTPPTLIERKRALAGWVYVPIRIEELLSGIVRASEDMIDFELVDGESTDKKDLLFDADGHNAENADTNIREAAFAARMFYKKTAIEAQGRVWTIYTSTRPEFERSAAHAHWVIPVGFLLSLLAALAMWSLVNARRRAEALAERMTQAVREREERWQLAVSGSNAGIWDWNVQTDETFYSPRWLSMLGLKAEEVSAQRQEWLQRVHADDLERVNDSIQAHFQRDTPFYFAEYRILHGDGNYRWVADTGQAQWDKENQVLRMVGSMTDITQRKQAEADVRDSESRMHAIVDSVTDAIVVIDHIGCISSFNPAAERIFGYPAQEIMGRNVSILMPEPYRGEHAGYLRRYLETGEARVMGKARELTGQRKDGSTFPMELAVARIAVKEEIMFTGIVRDITERQKVDRMKNEFVSTVSHELRTPLTSIRGSLGLISGGALGALPEKMRQMVDIAQGNSDRLIRLINDILDIDKIESGKMAITLQNHALMPLIEQSIEANHAYAGQFGVRYQLTQSDGSASVNVDAGRLMQVMANLLSNAAKFSPPNGVVSISVRTQDNRVRVAVSDQGPGIPESYRDKIFQKFTQADSSDTRQKGGTGLGLAISKALVERMHGGIGFETSTQGTTFWFDLPLGIGIDRADDASHAA